MEADLIKDGFLEALRDMLTWHGHTKATSNHQEVYLDKYCDMCIENSYVFVSVLYIIYSSRWAPLSYYSLSHDSF